AMLELTQITSLIAIVFLLWSANIWICGLQQARKLSPRDAALCVGIPVIAYILYIIYTLGVS
ncbi:MAG: YIP1 family protein, partial [Methanoregula sp.]